MLFWLLLFENDNSYVLVCVSIPIFTDIRILINNYLGMKFQQDILLIVRLAVLIYLYPMVLNNYFARQWQKYMLLVVTNMYFQIQIPMCLGHKPQFSYLLAKLCDFYIVRNFVIDWANVSTALIFV